VIQVADGFVLGGSTKSFGMGGEDFWLVKTDFNGKHEWNHTYGGPADDVFREGIQTADGGFALLGGTWSYGAGGQDWWFVKTDASGKAEWNRTYGGSVNDRGLSIVETFDGGFGLAGGTQSYGPGGADYWLIKTDALGQPEWNHTYGGPNDDFGKAVIQTDDNGFAHAGGTTSFGLGFSDLWLVKTNVSGHHEWNQTYGGHGGEGHCEAVVQTADGGFALALETSSYGVGGDDFWLVRADVNGHHLWNKTFGGSADEHARYMIQNTNGEFVLVGWTKSYGAGGQDVWLMKTRDHIDSTPTTGDTVTTTTEESSTQTTPSWTLLIGLMFITTLLILRKGRENR
jgi:predicted secreted protein